MKRLRKFLRRPREDRRLLMAAVWLLAAIRLGLWLLPLHHLQSLLRRLIDGSEAPQRNETVVPKVVWAVSVACQFVPGSRCLAQALAAQALLARLRHPARLQIGVARGESRRLQVHAWLEDQGKVVIGGVDSPSVYEAVPVSFIR